ncbi:hypothetical protein BJP34_06205 [Moorena producens PAL-8-15-08-1]|uniref:Uncharacterized protein n=1 Tax=Moorena producens PAL-8-15-08-1 TaxID=1458985 RepID=A0A1D8TNW7_9CYAN|nr:effector-associated domain EAD1-containing protein [Moorena producens]AOW99095.1 hypothetical protein BJP34_06205 [Moorena producens PAL-8-15-08-1]
MNAGNPPGYILAQIESALCSAFHSEIKLAMMLRHQFNINLAQVASGEDLTEIVYKVVLYFEARNRLGNLLDGALNENSDNYDLRQLYSQEFNIPPSLLTILFPLPNNIIEAMQQAYQACCPNNFWDDWEDELPDSLAEILENLDDIPQPTDEEKLIVQFVAHLLKTGDISKPDADKLKQWLEKNANNPSDLLSQSSSHYQNHQQPNLDAQPYLLVKLDSSKQYHQQRQPSYFVSAWFITDLSNYDYLGNHQHCKFLETPPADGESEQDLFSIEDLPKLIEFFINQLIHYSREYYRQPILVFFLPYQLLNHELERIEIQDYDDLPIPIGSEYCVIFRSVKRLKKYRYQGKWLNKWTQIQDNCKTICLSNFAFSNFEYWQELYTDLEERKAIAVKLHQPPCEQILKVIDRTAIPVTLWLRKNNFTTINCQQALEQLLKCQINELPEKVKQQRLQAFPKGNKQEHIGHHLALLWEDPYLLPPQIDYTTL